jgi:predicted transglutaminase-like cysteine proteinase
LCLSRTGAPVRNLHWIKGVIAAAISIVAADRAGAMQAQPSLPAITISAPAAGVTRAVPAWLTFCEKRPEECSVDLGEPETISLTRSVWQQILAVNARVNASVEPLTDEAHWGVTDEWDFPADGYGDCEDYQLLKRKLLVEGGLPRRALRMTVVIDQDGEGHAVLMARTDRGDFILDNKTSAIRPWHRTGYSYVKRENQDGSGWTSLGGANAPIFTANR